MWDLSFSLWHSLRKVVFSRILHCVGFYKSEPCFGWTCYIHLQVKKMRHFSEILVPIYMHGITSRKTIIFLFSYVRKMHMAMLWTKMLCLCNQFCYKLWDEQKKKRGGKLMFLVLPWISHSLCVHVHVYVSECFRNLYVCACVEKCTWRVCSWLIFCPLPILSWYILVVLITIFIILIDRQMKRSRLQNWIHCTCGSWTQQRAKWINFRRRFRNRRMLNSKND